MSLEDRFHYIGIFRFLMLMTVFVSYIASTDDDRGGFERRDRFDDRDRYDTCHFRRTLKRIYSRGPTYELCLFPDRSSCLYTLVYYYISLVAYSLGGGYRLCSCIYTLVYYYISLVAYGLGGGTGSVLVYIH